MTIWVVSDTHFGHSNIIQYAGRPFANVREMDECMLANWNAVVKPADHVYHLGDVAINKPTLLRRCLNLNGHLRLVMGNHDQEKASVYKDAGFEKIFGSRLIDGLLLTHIPVHINSIGAQVLGNVHGHIHEREYPYPYLNVSVEQTAYAPITLDECKVLLEHKRQLQFTPEKAAA